VTNGHKDAVTYGTQLILDLLLAHQAMGRDLEEVIRYLQRTIARRQREGQEQ
jgi:hypothetical protein